MAEVQSRPSASRGGRGSTRAGRGGFSSRGGGRSAPRTSNGDTLAAEDQTVSLEDEGELGQLKKQYQNQLQTLKELFPDWSDEDLVYALQERNGDIQTTIEDITEGKVSRFADVTKKTKEKSRTKTKDAPLQTTDTTGGSIRGGRGRGGLDGGRGGRGGRGSDRGRGGVSRGGRGGSAPPLNFGGRNSGVSVPTVESTAWNASTENATAPGGWDAAAATSVGTGEDTWGTSTSEAVSEPPKSSLIPQGTTKSWASMLSQPKPAPVIPKPVVAESQQPAAHVPEEIGAPETLATDDYSAESGVTAGTESGGLIGEALTTEEPAVDSSAALGSVDADGGDDASALAPSGTGDKLTEEALEHIPDTSRPVPTETAASTLDATSVIGGSTPFASSQQVPTLGSRPPMGGFATSAWKAAGTPGRASSFQRMMDQREAVVMPGSHGVDRATVQFGSMGLNGDSDPLDVEDDREEVETRAQLPQDPVQAQPKASLPPAPQQSQHEQPTSENLSTPKPAPGLDMPHQTSGQGAPGLGQPASQQSSSYGQYGRYGGFGQQEHTAPSQKPYDPFSNQLNYGQGQDQSSGYGGFSQTTGPASQQGQSHLGGYGQGQSDYANQSNTEQSRGGYQGYTPYGSSYGQQPSTSHQEQASTSQRATSGYGVSDSSYGQSGQLGQTQSRFGESQASGSNTPAPATSTQQQPGQQSQQGQQMHQQSHQQQGGHYGGGYGNPYYGNSYYSQYMNQYPNYNYNQHSYGQPYNQKNNMYGQPHHGYGMSPQTSYEQSTPSGASGFGSSSNLGRDTAFSSGYGASEYGRSGSAAPSQSQQGTSSYGGYQNDQSDTYGSRGASSAINNNPSGVGQYGNSGVQGGAGGLKPFDDNKAGSSPSLNQPGRAGSAVNNSGYGAGGAGSNQSNFPPPQGQQGFNQYGPGSHSGSGYGQHGSQYGGLGGLGGHQANTQSHQQGGGYGNYGSGFGGGSGYGNYGRGGWGGNYGH